MIQIAESELSCLRYWLMLVALAGALLQGGGESALAETITFDVAHQHYLSLRNTDLSFYRIAEWHQVAKDFIRASWQEKNPLNAQRSLYEAAILYRTLATNRQKRDNLLRAVAALEELVGRFPLSELGDDALLVQAEIFQSLGGEELARELLREIVERYPESDMVFVARKRLSAISQPAHTQPETKSNVNAHLPIVVIDPGHGGEDFGALGVGGLLEKDVALSIALRVKKLIEHSQKYRVVLTRATDRFAPLAERMALANRLNAQLFLSIHANASISKNLSGVETYYLDNTADKASAKLAERENKVGADHAGVGEDLSFMLSDLIQNAKLPESIDLARRVQRGVVGQLRGARSDVIDHGVKAGPFYVLVGAHMPCALVEVSFIDHPREGAFLGEEHYRERIAEGIVQGISGR